MWRSTRRHRILVWIHVHVSLPSESSGGVLESNCKRLRPEEARRFLSFASLAVGMHVKVPKVMDR